MAKKAKKAKAAKKGKRSSAKRSLLKNAAGNFYAKRKTDGTFKDLDEMGRSQKADRARKAKKKVKSGYGDQGDQ